MLMCNICGHTCCMITDTYAICKYCSNRSTYDMTDYSDAYCLNLYEKYMNYCKEQSFSENRRKYRLKEFALLYSLNLISVRTLLYRGSVLHIMKLKYTDNELKSFGIVLNGSARGDENAD